MKKLPVRLAWVCWALFPLLLTSAIHAEIRPTGSQPRLFRDQLKQIPERWRIKTLPTGRDYLLATYYGSFNSTVESEQGPMPFSNIPWAQEAIVRVSYNELKNPEIFQDLLENKTNPIMFFGFGYYQEAYKYPGYSAAEIDEYFQLVLKAKEAFGPRFLCLDYCEWTWGGVSGDKTTDELTKSLDVLKISPPTNADEAVQWWNQTYDLTFKRYQDAGIPILSWNNTSLNHYEARKGCSLTGNEIGYNNAANDGVLTAFCRGAARQYGIPWGMYAAGFGGHFGHNTFTYTRSPDERRFKSGRLYSAYSAVPLQEQRRTLFSTYMAGANFQLKESDSAQGMVSNYDPQAIEKTNPRVLALQDEKTYVGPYARLFGELWDNIVQRHDRGTPYTPVALLFDKHHGYAFKYSKTLKVGGLPYTTADRQMRGVMNTLFPHEADQYAVPPFGEIFDVITTDAAPDVIGSYRALVLTGPTQVDEQLAGVLKQFVENGGVLVLACEQLTPELRVLAGIEETGELGNDNAFLRASDFHDFREEPFQYHRVKLNGAEPLFLAHEYDNRHWPVATIHRVREGAVIVGTPVWMNVEGDPTKMHGLFSEIVSLIADELIPLKIYGSKVKAQFSRNKAGWVVTLMNPRGTTIAYPGFKPAINENETAGVVLKPKFKWSSASEWLTEQTWSDVNEKTDVSLVIPPGEIRIVEFKLP